MRAFASLSELQFAVAAIVLFILGGKSGCERLQHSAFLIDVVLCSVYCVISLRLCMHSYACMYVLNHRTLRMTFLLI